MTLQPSDYVFAEAMQLTNKARDIAANAAYGQVVLNLLLDEDRSKYGWLEFHLKLFDIRRKMKKELKTATRINNFAEKTLRRAQQMKLQEVKNGGGGEDT